MINRNDLYHSIYVLGRCANEYKEIEHEIERLEILAQGNDLGALEIAKGEGKALQRNIEDRKRDLEEADRILQETQSNKRKRFQSITRKLIGWIFPTWWPCLPATLSAPPEESEQHQRQRTPTPLYCPSPKRKKKAAPPSTTQADMKKVRQIKQEVDELLATDKRLSARLCAVLKQIEKKIHQEVTKNEQQREQARQEREAQRQQEQKELDEDKRNAAW